MGRFDLQPEALVATAERKTVGQQASCPPCLTAQDVDDPELCCRDHPSGGRGVADVETSLCALLSAVLLVGLAANAVLGWWWADPAAGLGIAALAAVGGVRTWRAESLADTCCD